MFLCLLQIGENMAEGASVPALGLSNKAVYQGKTIDMYEDRQLPPSANEQYSESSFRPLELSGKNCCHIFMNLKIIK